MAKSNGCKEHFWKEKGCKDCKIIELQAEVERLKEDLEAAKHNNTRYIEETARRCAEIVQTHKHFVDQWPVEPTRKDLAEAIRKEFGIGGE